MRKQRLRLTWQGAERQCGVGGRVSSSARAIQNSATLLVLV